MIGGGNASNTGGDDEINLGAYIAQQKQEKRGGLFD